MKLYLALGSLIFFFPLFASQVKVSVNKTESSFRKQKVLSMFQVVTFQNTVCTGSSLTRNGTCYTAEECSSKGGAQSGSCAQGFGVCCTFTLDCGGRSSQNLTYFSKSLSGTVDSPCTYTICPAGGDICKIKLDFTSFNIAGPTAGTLNGGAGAATVGTVIGDCASDTFTVSNPGGSTPPLICGFNTGQHMILDVSMSNCITLAFNLLSGTSTSKEWDIVATQYTCQDSHDLVGSPGSGCLQFHTGTTGTFQSFNWPSGTHTTAATHLSNQEYAICVRQEPGYCSICYSAAIATPFTASTFGVGLSTAAIATSSTTACPGDYIIIPDAGSATLTAIAASVSTVFCGRYLAAEAAVVTSATTAANLMLVSVCSFTNPFTLTVHFDADETIAASTAMAQDNEDQVAPTGYLGFQLNYAQQMC